MTVHSYKTEKLGKLKCRQEEKEEIEEVEEVEDEEEEKAKEKNRLKRERKRKENTAKWNWFAALRLGLLRQLFMVLMIINHYE